jgi:hypothetical protein
MTGSHDNILRKAIDLLLIIVNSICLRCSKYKNKTKRFKVAAATVRQILLQITLSRSTQAYFAMVFGMIEARNVASEPSQFAVCGWSVVQDG